MPERRRWWGSRPRPAAAPSRGRSDTHRGEGGSRAGTERGHSDPLALFRAFLLAWLRLLPLVWPGREPGWPSRSVRPPGPGPSQSQQVTGAGSGPPGTVLFEPFWSFAPSRSPRRGGLGPCRDRARPSLSIDERVVSLRQCSRASAFLVHRILTARAQRSFAFQGRVLAGGFATLGLAAVTPEG